MERSALFSGPKMLPFSLRTPSLRHVSEAALVPTTRGPTCRSPTRGLRLARALAPFLRRLYLPAGVGADQRGGRVPQRGRRDRPCPSRVPSAAGSRARVAPPGGCWVPHSPASGSCAGPALLSAGSCGFSGSARVQRIHLLGAEPKK